MYFDIAMPTVLFVVTLVSVLLGRKAESKLRSSLEEKQMRTRDTALLVIAIGVMVSVIVFVPEMALMAVFLFSYSMLLFLFSYIFSGLSRAKASLFYLVFLTIAIGAGLAIQFNYVTDVTGTYGLLAFYALSAFAVGATAYEQMRTGRKERWFLAVLPPALFLSMYFFFNGGDLWRYYLVDAYGVLFAVLIVLYIGSLFTWKTTLIFSGVLTILDIVLVLGTGLMVAAAEKTLNLGLPVLVSVPIVPLIITGSGAIQMMRLGLGDFFFAGVLAIQTWKKFGKNWAILSILAMCTSFSAFQILLLNYGPIAFPGTLMIICGWVPLAAWKTIRNKTRTVKPQKDEKGQNSGPEDLTE